MKPPKDDSKLIARASRLFCGGDSFTRYQLTNPTKRISLGIYDPTREASYMYIYFALEMLRNEKRGTSL